MSPQNLIEFELLVFTKKINDNKTFKTRKRKHNFQSFIEEKILIEIIAQTTEPYARIENAEEEIVKHRDAVT